MPDFNAFNIFQIFQYTKIFTYSLFDVAGMCRVSRSKYEIILEQDRLRRHDSIKFNIVIKSFFKKNKLNIEISQCIKKF